VGSPAEGLSHSAQAAITSSIGFVPRADCTDQSPQAL
jgi:hypothetical protein